MRSIITSDKVQRIEFFSYYVSMIILCGFIGLYCLFYGGVYYLLAPIAWAGSLLCIIILFSYFKKINYTQGLLKAYIILLTFLLVSSLILEILLFDIGIYPFVMKVTLYIFCISTPIKHLYLLKEKITLYRKHVEWIG